MSHVITKTVQHVRSMRISLRSMADLRRSYSLHDRSKVLMLHRGVTSTIHSKRCSSNQNLVESPYSPVELSNKNLVDFIYDEMDEVTMEKAALTCGATGRSYNYGMMKLLVNRFAQAVTSQLQMKPRQVLGLLLPNLPEFAIVCHGALKAGLPVTFVNPLFTANEIRRQFQNAEVKIIVTVPQLLEVATAVSSDLVDYKGTILVGGEDDLGRRIYGLKSLLTTSHDTELPGIHPKELAILPYSSGTTGVPKGVMLSHYNLVSNLVQTDNPDLRLDDGERVRIFTVLPFFHIFGFNTILNSSLALGMHLISLPRFTPEDYIACLVKYKPEVLFVVPSLVTFLTENGSVRKEHLENVRYIKSGAAPLTEVLAQRFKHKFGNDIMISQGYGMTESSPVAITMPKSGPPSKVSSIGVLVPNTVARIVDLKSGDSLGPNQSGELQIRGPQVMMGYLNNETATKETIDGDGWLHTGDVAYYDDGYFFLIDRCKELIKVKGNQVSPTELENLLLEIPDVAEAAVIGVPDALADEVPRAFVVKKTGSHITDKDILKYVNARVVHYKKLAGGVVFIEVIPRNPSGKILRNELKVLRC